MHNVFIALLTSIENIVIAESEEAVWQQLSAGNSIKSIDSAKETAECADLNGQYEENNEHHAEKKGKYGSALLL
jgi:hypothetical protein